MRANIIVIAGALVAPLPLTVGLLVSRPASAEYRDFCGSVPSACPYTGPWAPMLGAVVCWSKSTSTATILSGSTCPTGTYPYFAKYGDVDVFGNVNAYIPLDDACTRPGLCQPLSLAPPNTTAAPMCCPDDCWPAESQQCVGEELLFCAYGASNDDGTVTCFDDQE